MSRAPRLLRELHETLLIMAGDMLPAHGTHTTMDNDGQQYSALSDDDNEILEVYATPAHPSNAIADKQRDELRSTRLRKNHAKALAVHLADRVRIRLGSVWRRVDAAAVNWAPSGEEHSQPDRDMHQMRRNLLFHIGCIMDVNECSLDFLNCSNDEREEYIKLLHGAVIREALQLDPGLEAHAVGLDVVFGLFHNRMRDALKNCGRREPNAALLYWKEANQTSTMISPVPFNTVARAALSSQASSAPAERLFSDLGRREGNQSQSMLTSALEMTEMIRVFVSNELRNDCELQNGLMHPTGRAFRRLVNKVACEIARLEHST